MNAISPLNRHSVYGITVETWIPFPELAPASTEAAVDAVFRLGEVPLELSDCRKVGARFQIAPGRVLVWLDQVARFLALDGREIIVEPYPGAIEGDLRVFLLCSPMGALLLQRGSLPLHASAVATPRGAVIFLGPSGVGKSTLAAIFQRRGFRIMADDISVVRFSRDGIPWIEPGLPQFKLWPDAIDRLGASSSDTKTLRPHINKRALSFVDGFQSEPLPLARIYLLRTRGGREVKIEPLKGAQCLPHLLENTYRAQFVPGLGLTASHFEAVSRLAGVVPLSIVFRAEQGGPEQIAAKIVADLGL